MAKRRLRAAPPADRSERGIRRAAAARRSRRRRRTCDRRFGRIRRAGSAQRDPVGRRAARAPSRAHAGRVYAASRALRRIRVMVSRVKALFAVLFALLVLRQAYVQIVAGPRIAANPYNPRHALLAAHRGRILASDGTALAQTTGYVSQRYGTSGLEDAYDRALTPADTTGDFTAQIGQIAEAITGKSSISRGADVVTTID